MKFEETNRAFRKECFLPEDLEVIPPQYGTEWVPLEQKVIHLHYTILHAMSAFDWWLVELDREEWLGFGFACLNGDSLNAEWGYIDLQELEGMLLAIAPTPVLVERDVAFTPQQWWEVASTWKR